MKTLILKDKDIVVVTAENSLTGNRRLILKTPGTALDIIGNLDTGREELCYIRQLERAINQESWYRYLAVYSSRFIDWYQADIEHVNFYNIALGRTCRAKNF